MYALHCCLIFTGKYEVKSEDGLTRTCTASQATSQAHKFVTPKVAKKQQKGYMNKDNENGGINITEMLKAELSNTGALMSSAPEVM